MELNMTFGEEKPAGVNSEWEKDVPILSSGKTVTAYLQSEVYEPEVYNELCYTLEHTDADKVVLKINNGGGQIDSFMAINNAIKNSSATVVAEIVGTVASAATMIALSCDEIIVDDHVSFMIHSASSGTGGKMHETKAYMEFSNKLLSDVFVDVYSGFLDDEELKKVLDGKDMWLNATEVKSRWDIKNGKNIDQ